MKKLLALIILCTPLISYSQIKLFAFRYFAPRILPDRNYEPLFNVYGGDTVEAITYYQGWFKVIKDGQTGYASQEFFKYSLSKETIDSLSKIGTADVNSIKAQIQKKKDENLAYEKEIKENAFKAEVNLLVKLYGKNATYRAMKGEMWIGMPIGLLPMANNNQSPDSRTKITDAKGMSELWTYARKEVYILNDKVFKIVESE
jgi:hypothetical protein